MRDQSTDHQVNFRPVSFNDNGTFSGANVSLAHPTIAWSTTTGRWGGRFSNRNDDAGKPRAVVGTFGVTGRTAGNSTETFVGVFHGVDDPSP